MAPRLFALMVALSVAVSASAAGFTAEHSGSRVEVTNNDPNGKLTAFSYRPPNDASITTGGHTYSATFEKDGSVTLNGANAKTNEQLTNLIAQSGMVATADELDALIGMLQRDEIRIAPKKRGDSLLQLLTLWRSRI